MQPLVSYILRGSYLADINVHSPMRGALATAFANLVKDMFKASSGATVCPSDFKRIVSAVQCDTMQCRDFMDMSCLA